MRISIGSDHGGYFLKEIIKKHFIDVEFIDEGTYSNESVDYPIYAKKVALDVTSGLASLGIAICTNGVGVCIVANKFKGTRAALCLNQEMAEHAKAHNDANILCLGAENQSQEEALLIVETFVKTPFSYVERHERRVEEIKQIEEESNL